MANPSPSGDLQPQKEITTISSRETAIPILFTLVLPYIWLFDASLLNRIHHTPNKQNGTGLDIPD